MMGRCARHPRRRPGRRNARHAAPRRAMSRASSRAPARSAWPTRTGAPYLALELRDRSGALPARLFRDADLQGGRFEARRARERQRTRRALPRARSRSSSSGSRAPTTPRSTRASSCRSPTATSTSSTASSSTSPARSPTPATGRCWTACSPTRPFRAQFRLAACTRAGHHAYLGGLLEHTVAVATLAQELCRSAPPPEQRPADLRRDRARRRQAPASSPTARDRDQRGGADARPRPVGLRLLRERAGGRLDERRLLALEHCVLCHHGADAAPGGRFASVEALALYRLNALDAAVKGALEHGLDARVGR